MLLELKIIIISEGNINNGNPPLKIDVGSSPEVHMQMKAIGRINRNYIKIIEGGINMDWIFVENNFRPLLVWWQMDNSSKNQIGKKRKQEKK